MPQRNNRYTTEEFIKKLESVWPDLRQRFDLSKIEYGKNNETKVTIICKKHGLFMARPSTLFKKHGCRKCYDEIAGNYHKSNKKEFIEKVQALIGDTYDLSQFVYINSLTKGKAICPKHGGWLITPNNILRGRKCPRCKSSTGETAIRRCLKLDGIRFEEQKKFKTCIYKKQLAYDFFIPSRKVLIEFNGQQHYSGKEWWGGKSNLKIVQIRDNIKRTWAKENGYTLLEIKYTQLKNIPELLSSIIS